MAEVLFTEPFKVESGRYISAVSMLMLGRLWWLLLLPLTLFIAGFYDWRWAVVGFIVLMLIYPVIVTTALMSHALRPEVVRRAASRRASFDGDKITLYHADVSDESVNYRAVETVRVNEAVSSGRMTRFNVGNHIYDFILIPTKDIPPSALRYIMNY